MACFLAFPVAGRLDEALSEVALPDPVHDDAGEATVFGTGDLISEVLGGGGEFRVVFVEGSQVRERPGGLDGSVGIKGHLDARLAIIKSLEEGGRDTGSGRDLQRGALQEGRGREEVGLSEGVEGGVVAPRTLELEPEEGGPDHVGLGRHGNVVLGSELETAGATAVTAAGEGDELGDEAVEGFVVEKRLVDPPPERSGVVEHRFDEAGVLGEEILPVADPVIGMAGVIEELVDEAGELVRRAVGEIRVHLLRGGEEPDRVEVEAAKQRALVEVGRDGDLESGAGIFPRRAT